MLPPPPKPRRQTPRRRNKALRAGRNSLSQNLTVLPAPSGREPLAKPRTLRFKRKLYRYAKGPILEGAVAEGDWGSLLCRKLLFLPQRRAFIESGAATAVFLYALSCENGFQESPQTFLKPEISNDFSAENAQSARGGHSKSSRPVESAFLARSFRQVCLDFPLKLC